MKDVIRHFIDSERQRDPNSWSSVDLSALNTAEELALFFAETAKAFGKMESDEFGAISHVIVALAFLHARVYDLPERYADTKQTFTTLYESLWVVLRETWGVIFCVAVVLNPNLESSLYLSPTEMRDAHQHIRLKIGDTPSPEPALTSSLPSTISSEW